MMPKYNIYVRRSLQYFKVLDDFYFTELNVCTANENSGKDGYVQNLDLIN